MNFADRLRTLRKEKGLTQVELAGELGLSKGTIAMWETGKRTPDYKVIKAMSDMFDRRIDYILGYSDDATSPEQPTSQIDSSEKWVVQSEQIDIIRQYLKLDRYGQMSVEALIQQEMLRCQEQGTEQDISTVKVGICRELTEKGEQELNH